MFVLNCRKCGKEFSVYRCRKTTARFCSKSCLAKDTRTGTTNSKSSIEKMRSNVWKFQKEIIEMYINGKTSRYISHQFSSNTKTILNILRQNNVLIRKASKPLGTPSWNKGKEYLQIRGNKNPNWKGGITKLNQVIRHCFEYKTWIKSIMERDNYTCVFCGIKGNNLEIDHFPKRFCDIIREEKINSYETAKSSKVLWDINNGRTLCVSCHNKTKSSSVKK
jgi:hypothetical protein